MKDLLLDDTDLFIKDNLDWILAGKYDDKFNKEQLDKMIELSFLYNHINIEGGTLIFEYGVYKLKIENLIQQHSGLIDILGNEAVKNIIVSTINTQDEFKSAFKSFLRDKKINKIIE